MLTTYTIEQNELWDAIIQSFKNYDSYWLSGYVKAFQLNGDGDPLLIYYEDQGTRGINVVMKRDIAKCDNLKNKIPEGKYFDITTPYGYGGWIIEGNEIGQLFQTYEKWNNKHHIISEFVRFHPLIKNHLSSAAFYDVTRLGQVVYMDLSSPDVIWKNLISQNRNKIRKALKNEVKIYNGRYPEIFDKFRDIYYKTMSHDSAEKYYFFEKEFFDAVMEELPENAQIFYAQKGTEIIAASIMLCANGYMNYHLSGSLKEYNHLAPVNLLLYKAALWGAANGCKKLYLGGGVGSGTDSLLTFKKSFNQNEPEHFFIGKKIYDQKTYSDLVETSGKTESSFFPVYRA